MDEESTGTSLGKARATPSKSFFVNMLTRDIELSDALLDLLDNCLDGVLRNIRDLEADYPYDGYQAKITLSSDEMVIEDNCGGIPLSVARDYAFSMGRPAGTHEELRATIGMYGIGMKRAIFKMGNRAVVESTHKIDGSYRVEFSPEWMADPEWKDLDIVKIEPAETIAPGTKIRISGLNEETSRFFDDDSAVDDFRTIVRQHYALIMSKGFSVEIGSPSEFLNSPSMCQLKPMEFRLLGSHGDDAGIQPIIYKGDIDGVKCEIYAGLNRPLLTSSELEEEENRRSTSDDSGWIVACNDRVVIWRDKTRLTGWGEAGVPNFHGQFLPISGIVLLTSDDPRLLPLTTTKRGIDGSSNTYSKVKDLMRAATQELTRFTNRWKKYSDERNSLYDESERLSLGEMRSLTDSGSFELSAIRKIPGVLAYRPEFPVPAKKETHARISYLVDKSDLARVGDHLFGDASYSREDVGLRSFELVLGDVVGDTH